ncbi:hypothetical protein EDC04DRAFT_158233 [Pisolithus marmoratus]|nr:hypothetical protein EDC04DRAFT_158233 [Pisolithus marmoratus]
MSLPTSASCYSQDSSSCTISPSQLAFASTGVPPPTTSLQSSSGTVVTTASSVSTTASISPATGPESSSHTQSGYLSTTQTSTIPHTPNPITSTATYPPAPQDTTLWSSSIQPTPGYTPTSSPFSEIPATTLSSMNDDMTVIVGSSVGAAAALCSIAVVALLFHLRSRRRRPDSRLDLFVDRPPTVPPASWDDRVRTWRSRLGCDQGRHHTSSESSVNLVVTGSDGPGSLSEPAESPGQRESHHTFATDSVVGVWPKEDRSAIARRTRSRKLGKFFPEGLKFSGATPTRTRKKKGRENHGRGGNRGVNGHEPHPESQHEGVARAESESSAWSLSSQLTLPHSPKVLTREWKKESPTQIGEVGMRPVVVTDGRTSFFSMKPAVQYPSPTCSETALLNNVSRDTQNVGAPSS